MYLFVLYFMVLYIISASARVVSELFFIFAQGKVGNDIDSRRNKNLSATGVKWMGAWVAERRGVQIARRKVIQIRQEIGAK